MLSREKFRPKLKATEASTAAAAAATASTAAAAAVDEAVEDGRDVPETNRISTSFKNRFRSDLKKGSNIVKVELASRTGSAPTSRKALTLSRCSFVLKNNPKNAV